MRTIQKRKKDRNYRFEIGRLAYARALLDKVRDALRETGAVQTRAAAARLAKSLDGAIRNAKAHANG